MIESLMINPLRVLKFVIRTAVNMQSSFENRSLSIETRHHVKSLWILLYSGNGHAFLQ